jgi:ABC-type multidrug transport system permease subunit
VAGIFIVLMILFSGFIQPYNQISYGWDWFYWLNPVAWILKAVTVNQWKSSR